jgi:phage baseplate assembly protein W
MDPNFGTNLRQLVFSLSGPIVNDAIFSDVQQAVNIYEPRAALVSMQATPNGRVINVNAAFQSLINGQNLTVQNLAVG